MDALRIQRREVGAEGRHAVLAGGQRHVAGGAGVAMTACGSLGIELADGGGDRTAPCLHARTFHLGHALVEHRVHLAALLVRQRCGRRGGRVGDAGGEHPATERGEHARHRADQAASRGEARARRRGRTVGGEGDVRRGSSVGLADELLERREEVVLVGDVVARGVDAVAPVSLGEGDERARLESSQGAERAVDHVQQVLDLLTRSTADLEHRPRIDGDGGEQVVDVAEQLRERGRAARVERSEDRLRSRLLRDGLRGDRHRHASMLRRTPDIRKDRRELWMTRVWGGEVGLSA